MSRSKGRSSLHEARYTAQLVYLMICVGLPFCPMEGYVHVMAFITIADVLLMCGGFPASLSKPCDRLCHCEKRYNVRMQLWDNRVFHTVADILSQRHWWWTSIACLECFTMRRFNHDALVATSVDDALFEAELFVKRVLILILTGSHY